MASRVAAFPGSKSLRDNFDPGRDGAGGGGIEHDHGGGQAPGGPIPLHTYYTGLWLVLGAIVMFFAGLTSAVVVRKGISSDWAVIALPRILFFNTLVLAASSFLLERARRQLRGLPLGKDVHLGSRLGAVLLLGLTFLVGQLGAWRDLAERGIFLATNPSSSFIYLLTGAHGFHLFGGLVAIGYAALRAPSLTASIRGRTLVDVIAIYWHFVGILWIYVLALLTLKM
ncbi:MAG TPA: cytochrome oxidase subunit III [Terriglobia bacterium]